MLSGAPEIEQASLFQGCFLDCSPFLQNAVAATEVDLGWCQIAEATVRAAVIVVIDEGHDRLFKQARQVIVLQPRCGYILDTSRSDFVAMARQLNMYHDGVAGL